MVWGRITWMVVWMRDMPSDRPASIWPASTAPMPLRISSAIYAPELMPKVTMPTAIPPLMPLADFMMTK